MHLFDLSATNIWIEYRSDQQVSGHPEKERMQHFDFKLLLAAEMTAQVDKVANDDEMNADDEEYIQTKKRRPVESQTSGNGWLWLRASVLLSEGSIPLVSMSLWARY